MKKIIALILALLMVSATLVACNEEEIVDETAADTTAADTTDGETEAPEGNQKPELVGTTYALNNTATWAKKLDGRMEATADYITCDWSASGIEFTATLKGDVVFEVDAKTKVGASKEGCYFRAYVDGAAYLNGESPYYEAKGQSWITLKNIPEGTHTIKLVKATGYTLANVDLKNVTLDGTVAETAPADKDLFIEFVGDSISCGWGVVGGYDGAYTAQDATLAYPYLIANTLNADYSVVAVSGQGIIKGNPGIAGGYKYASPYRSTTTEYGFARKANVVVINADTNDSYDNYPVENYINALKSFVEYVRAKNGNDAHIILVCNMMRTDYTDAIKELTNTLGGMSSKYYYYKATTAAGVHSAHPTAEENVTYASEIGGMIDAILKGTYEESAEPAAPTIPVNLTPIYSQNFDNATTAAQAGVTPLYNQTLQPTIVDGKLSVPKTGWKNGGPFGTLVGRDVFAGTPQKYVIDMDVEISELGVIGLIFNGTTPAASDTAYRRNSAFFVALRLGSGVDKLVSGTIADKAATHDIYVRTAYFKTADAAQVTDTKNDKVALDLKTGDTKATLKFTIVVDSSVADGCQVNIFADGTFIYGYKMDNNFDVNVNSYISLWAQDAVFTIDNLVVSTFN